MRCLVRFSLMWFLRNRAWLPQPTSISLAIAFQRLKLLVFFYSSARWANQPSLAFIHGFPMRWRGQHLFRPWSMRRRWLRLASLWSAVCRQCWNMRRLRWMWSPWSVLWPLFLRRRLAWPNLILNVLLLIQPARSLATCFLRLAFRPIRRRCSIWQHTHFSKHCCFLARVRLFMPCQMSRIFAIWAGSGKKYRLPMRWCGLAHWRWPAFRSLPVTIPKTWFSKLPMPRRAGLAPWLSGLVVLQPF